MQVVIKIRGKNAKANKNSINPLILVAAIGFFAILTVMILTALPPNYNYSQGDVAKENIVAPHTIVDEKTTEKLRDQEAAGVNQVYTRIENAHENAVDKIENLFSAIQDKEELTDAQIADIRLETINISDTALLSLAELSTENIEALKNKIVAALDELYQGEISMQNLSQIQEDAVSGFKEESADEPYSEIGAEILSKIIQPNMILDVESTQKAVEEARQSIPTLTYEAGELIVESGEILTSEKIDLLVDNNMMRKSYFDDPYLIIGIIVLLLGIFSVYHFYLRSFYKEFILKDNKRFSIIVIIFALMVILTIPLSKISPYIIPVSMMTMTIALLTDKRLAITSTIFFVVIAGLNSDFNMIQITAYILNGYIGAIGMIKISKRADIMRTGLAVGIVNLILIGSYNLIIHNFDFAGIMDMILGFSNGLISGIFTLGTLVIWEYAFDITTPIMLVELANPNNPLLKKLMTNAPGTYHHSIVVGNLAESAAEKIGANSLLVRVGAYYHDIGKSLSPVYFTENQFGEINPHDFISPQKSVQIIKNHVTKGFEMAKENKIPSEVRNFILTHHGESTIEFFYHKASEGNEKPEIEKFKYEAKKPSTKEEGILALADSVEAAVRSIKGINDDKIAERVDKIFQKKLSDGMLDECDLSLKEISIIKEVFVKILNSVYHERIEYPEIGIDSKSAEEK